MDRTLQDLARRRAQGQDYAEIESITGMPEEYLRSLTSSDAFKALEREEVIRLRGGDG